MPSREVKEKLYTNQMHKITLKHVGLIRMQNIGTRHEWYDKAIEWIHNTSLNKECEILRTRRFNKFQWDEYLREGIESIQGK